MNAGMKLAAALILTAACAALGWSAALKQTRRAKALRALCHAVSRLKEDMLEKRMPLRDALAASRHPLMTRAARESEACEPGEALRMAAASLSMRGGELDSLTREDMAAIERLAGELGQGGAARQRLLLSETEEELCALASGAEKLAAERGRLYVSLGALGGLALAVLMV